MLGTGDQTKLSVTYTRGRLPGLSSKRGGMFSENSVIAANSAQLRSLNLRIEKVPSYAPGDRSLVPRAQSGKNRVSQIGDFLEL